MRDFQLLEAGFEPHHGSRAVVLPFRRGLRKLLRPVLVRLSEILDSLADRLDVCEVRLDTAAGRAELALDKIRHGESRADEAERRLDKLEAAAEILMNRSVGTTTHLQGLTAEHNALSAQVEGIHERLDAFVALHWDHVALVRRLATIEDLLAGVPRDSGATDPNEPLLPFPGCDDRSRARVG